jgi:S1-C subfamily serine protease
MKNEPTVSPTWQALSNESAAAIEKAGRSVVAVHARRRIPASGVHWRPGIVVTADHALEHDDEIPVTLPGGRTMAASLAGRDSSTDLAILRIDTLALPAPETGDVTHLKVGHWVLAAGLTAEGSSRASLALVGVVGPAWRTWRGGLLDHTVRLDRNLHPNFSGGPAVDDQGRVLGINTAGLSRYAAVVIPASTVDRVVAELEKKGRIGQGYIGVGLQPVRVPRKLRESLNLESPTGIMIVQVEPDGPAEKAGLTLGDVLVTLDERPVRDIGDVQIQLARESIGKALKASIIRAGTLTDVVISVGERPAVS